MGFWKEVAKVGVKVAKAGFNVAVDLGQQVAAQKTTTLSDDELEQQAKHGSPLYREMAIDEMRNRPSLSHLADEYEDMHLDRCADSDNPDLIYMAIAGYERRRNEYMVNWCKRKLEEIEKRQARGEGEVSQSSEIGIERERAEAKTRREVAMENGAKKRAMERWAEKRAVEKQMSAIDPSTVEHGKFTDPRDGQTYRTVKIGEQIWMAQNLNFEPSNGNSWCYDDDPANGEKYGRLYDWETAKKVCPPGWHLARDEEWKTLVNACGGEKTAGRKLKSKSGWKNDGNGIDEFGFSALPGGYRWNDSFYGVGCSGRWWTATEFDWKGGARRWIMNGDKESVSYDWEDRARVFSVRCIKDD